MKKSALPFCALLVLSVAAGQAGTESRNSFSREISRLEQAYGGHLGLMAKNLKTGEVVAVNATERFPTASVIKFPILAAFFRMVDEKKIDPNEWVTLAGTDMKPGSGVLRLLSAGDRITLLDAVKLMITQSDNTATNMVLDRLAPTHEQRLAVVNGFLTDKGLQNTRILNRLFSMDTKQRTPEAVRYGIGVSTPEDMVALLEGLYAGTLVSSASCAAMMDILKSQSYRDVIPRFLPEEDCRFLEVANKTGSVNETKVDVGLILSDRADIALAVFVDKHPDHRGDLENRGVLLGAMAARAVWNHFTGSRGYEERRIPLHDVDWNSYPGGRWGIYRTDAAPFPHARRRGGFKAAGGARYPFHPHYDDNSVVVVIPDTFKESEDGADLIVHVHGAMTDNMGVLERDRLPQVLAAAHADAILVLPQGPFRSPDAFGGKLEDKGGLRRLVEDVLATMAGEKIIKAAKLRRLILSAEGAGGQSVAAALERGGLDSKVTHVFLFDALSRRQESLRGWLALGRGTLTAVHSVQAAPEHEKFRQMLSGEAQKRIHIIPAAVDASDLVQTYLGDCLDGMKPGGHNLMKEQDTAAPRQSAGPSAYDLVWADEFDREGPPDPANWTFETGFVRNQELQWYQPGNARVEKGMLIIEARRERVPNPNYTPGSSDWKRNRASAEYTSSSLLSRGLHQWQYGRFEMRARIDTRPGMWPAFWTLGVSGGWPRNGEVDIMEYYRGMLLANAAWGSAERGKAVWDDLHKPITSFGDPDWAKRFHTWRMDWDEDFIRLYVDDLLLKEVDLSRTINRDGTGRNPFRQPHYVIVNLAVGGQGGDPSATVFPAVYEIDYIRIYRKR